MADVCIVGGGAAGISLARQLAGTGLQVILLEAGGREPTPDSPLAYSVEPGAQPRLDRPPSVPWYLGGNTNHWFGNCRPLDACDFEVRDWIPNSGWPFGLEELRPFYERAQAMSGLGDFRWYDPEACRPYLLHPPADMAPGIVKTRVLQACPVLSFAELHGRSLEEASDVRIALGSRALRLNTSADGTSVEAVETVDGRGRRSHVQAGVFVLACGGIENARLLLCSNERSRNGLGNDDDLVGRFFMEHWYVDVGLGDWHGGDVTLYTSRPNRDGQADSLQKVGDALVWAHFALSETLMQRERAAGLSLWFGPNAAASPSVAATGRIVRSLMAGSLPTQFTIDARLVLTDPVEILRRLRRRLGSGGRPMCKTLRIELEQTPSAANRIRLSAARDSLGEPRAELDVRLNDDDRRSHVRALRIAADAFGWKGARIAKQVGLMLEGGRFGFFFHHMGTTRMSDRPTHGVVDRDCRVHGISNLYVAGSSVFPTAGTAAPTLTIVALALRLADHIQDRLRRPQRN